MGALEDWREAAALPRGIDPGSSGLPWAMALLVSEPDPVTNRVEVSIRGSQPVLLPFLPGDYAGATTVYVQLDPLRTGAGQVVLGPAGAAEEPDVAPEAPSGVVTARTTILPTWSGTYRVSRAAWDRWNVDRYGGRSDVYQGDAYGSGQLIGLVTYGDQVQGLGATEITAIRVGVRRNGSGTDGVAIVLQGSPHGSKPSGAPASSGATATSTAIDPNASVPGGLALPAEIREGMRTGAVRGLCTVGGTYAGIYGADSSTGLQLDVTYTRPA